MENPFPWAILNSQTPSQPKGIGDNKRKVKALTTKDTAKPPHSRKALETPLKGEGKGNYLLPAKPPHSRKALETHGLDWCIHICVLAAKPPHSRKALETPGFHLSSCD